MKICFVTDGGAQLGLGHVLQSITLARALAEGNTIRFLTKSDEAVLARIRDAGFEAERLEDDDAILRRLAVLSPEVVIFDKLDVAEELARDIRRTLPARLVIFTNITAANRHAHVAVTADIGSSFENQRYIDAGTGTLTFFGPKYWVLRPEFGQFAGLGKAVAGKARRLLLMFGGSDPANLTSAALDALLAQDTPYAIEVVLGGHYGHDADLAAVLERHPDKRAAVAIHRNIGNVAELMHRADLVVVAPGLSAFESLRVGTPVIVVPHNGLQRDTYLGHTRMLERHELHRLGAMIEAGDCTRPDDAHILRMEIGQGIEELKAAILGAPGGGKE